MYKKCGMIEKITTQIDGDFFVAAYIMPTEIAKSWFYKRIL